MKANELIRENRWLLDDDMAELKAIILDADILGGMKFYCLNNSLGHSYDNHGGGVAISIDELKRLVESHELVKDYYGLTRAKEHAESNYTAPEIKNALKQAIADVESCMEVS